MIRVQRAEEPEHFDATVRQPGRRALAEMVGETGRGERRGRPRAVVASQREDVPADRFPTLWREVIPDLLKSYNRICAYMAVFIEQVTGAPTVDHFVPLNQSWEMAYEWSNYRLACSSMNSRKRDRSDIMDPFEVENDWFDLELFGFQIRPAEGLAEDIRARVVATIEKLGLRDQDCCNLRREYAQAFWDGDISWARLRRRAPFVAAQLKRHGRDQATAK